jgi:hypothetical protein
MKNFVKENWYKLMIGSSMMMASFGFMIYAISPVYSNSKKEKTEIKNTGIPNTLGGTNGIVVGDYAYFVDGGYLYCFETDQLSRASGFIKDQWSKNYNWIGNEFIYNNDSDGRKFKYGIKTKLP